MVVSVGGGGGSVGGGGDGSVGGGGGSVGGGGDGSVGGDGSLGGDDGVGDGVGDGGDVIRDIPHRFWRSSNWSYRPGLLQAITTLGIFSASFINT